MNNRSLLAVVVILLLGIFAVLGINVRHETISVFEDSRSAGGYGTQSAYGTNIQNN